MPIELTSRFYDSTAEDPREYSSSEWSEVFKHLAGNGIIPGEGKEFNVRETDPLALSVIVDPGVVFINGRYGKLSTSQTLNLSAADPTYDRIDRVVLRLNLDTAVRKMYLDVLTGTPAASPSSPALTRSGDIYELSIAQILVPAGATSINNSHITSEKNDHSVCGFGLPFGYMISQRIYGIPREDVITRDENDYITKIETYFPDRSTGVLRWKEELTRDGEGNVTRINRTAYASDGTTIVYTSTEIISRDGEGNIIGVVVS